jgi:hypothetical protein
MPASETAPLETGTFECPAFQPEMSEIIRYLGYPAGAAPRAQVQRCVGRTIEQARGKLRLRAIYSIYGVAGCDSGSLALSGGETFVGRIGEFLGSARRVVVVVATAGAEIVELCNEAARSGDVPASLVFHAIGSAAAEACLDRFMADLRTRLDPGEALTSCFSPGYCGISIQQQRKVFGLVDAARIGVELLPSLIMKPIKSVSGLIGIGPAAEITDYGNPCTRCELPDCPMRR